MGDLKLGCNFLLFFSMKDTFFVGLGISRKAKTNNAGKSRGVAKQKKHVPGRVEDEPNEKSMC